MHASIFPDQQRLPILLDPSSDEPTIQLQDIGGSTVNVHFRDRGQLLTLAAQLAELAAQSAVDPFIPVGGS